ncbi:Glycoside hydrolase/deacetylase, beta/alpha-barrel [Syntrophomonas zehnderi OL-4]|uniref:Glycoside hydrolase/deacetylase, beta/alpha-barrel n=1 Tax=Syntrophomonas zehnderi OL-4 TaxID=690567 RepID=A0A0E4GBX2_9FIRM|nr:glycoside hydrolase family 57 protein [Syntrophomonas zehnderi]CFW97613.1 Glycoside hydrolase/deacetylase, beta/alpha-barrel [Syntrophomonas zehnderi OL-4]
MNSNIMLVLHSHIPYVKRQGRWPFGEVWLFEAMAETYVPFLQTWFRLQEEGIRAPVTLSFSPTLLDQLSSSYIQQEFVVYLREREKKAAEDERYYLSVGEPQIAALSAFYHRFYRDIRRDFLIELDGDIIAALKKLQGDGDVEIITTAASHAYLPLLDQSSLHHQIYWGKRAYETHFGISPEGFWLPECGYYQGLEDLLIANGFKYFYVDSHAVEGGQPLGDFSRVSAELECDCETFANTGLSTYRPYRIKGKDIMVLGRNAMVSQQVWSADYGYPGDENYREFHKKSSRSGFKYWKVTDRQGSFDKKLPYDPEKAMLKVRQHAQHFVKGVENTGHEAHKLGFSQPIIVACYDTELFGHWWWEGVSWLDEVVRGINKSSHLSFILPADISPEMPEAQVFESSWGMGGKHYVWDNKETTWMWEIIKRASSEYEEIFKNRISGDLQEKVLAQALRELILLESSDWLFMVTNNLTRDYAMKRFFEHYAKFLRLTNALRDGNYSNDFLSWLENVQMEDDFLSYM